MLIQGTERVQFGHPFILGFTKDRLNSCHKFLSVYKSACDEKELGQTERES